MGTSADEADKLLFTCRHCGHWPMAFLEARSWTRESAFVCPRCKASAIFNLPRERRVQEEAAAG
jgi:hypothetical protein